MPDRGTESTSAFTCFAQGLLKSFLSKITYMQVLPLSGFQRNAFHKTNKRVVKKRKHELKLFGLNAYLLHLQTLKSGNPSLVFFHQGWFSFSTSKFCFAHDSPEYPSLSNFFLQRKPWPTATHPKCSLITSFRWIAELKHKPTKPPFLLQKEMRRGGKSP